MGDDDGRALHARHDLVERHYVSSAGSPPQALAQEPVVEALGVGGGRPSSSSKTAVVERRCAMMVVRFIFDAIVDALLLRRSVEFARRLAATQARAPAWRTMPTSY